MPIAFSKPHSYIPESLRSVFKMVNAGSDRVLPLYLLVTEFISCIVISAPFFFQNDLIGSGLETCEHSSRMVFPVADSTMSVLDFTKGISVDNK